MISKLFCTAWHSLEDISFDIPGFLSNCNRRVCKAGYSDFGTWSHCFEIFVYKVVAAKNCTSPDYHRKIKRFEYFNINESL